MKLDAFALNGVDDARPSRRPASHLPDDGGVSQRIAHAQAAFVDGCEPADFDRQLDAFVEQHAVREVRAVAHRIVHGGVDFSAALIVDEATQQALARLTALAPLHMPLALDWVDRCRRHFGPSVPQIAVFDTAFFSGLPAVARHYAIPLELQRSHGVRRFGFHGLAHASMLRQVQTLCPDLDGGGRLVTIQLGGGCSMAALKHGTALDTSMGFSPLEGLVMATRAGDIDAGLLTFLQRSAGFTAESLERVLNLESGLRGVSGLSADVRALLSSGSPDSQLAIELYCYRIRKYVGSYLAVLGGADAIAIGGGVGENSPEIRERVFAGMEWCGVVLDRERNTAARGTGGSARISSSAGSVDVWVISVDEGTEMARQAISVLEAMQPQGGRSYDSL